MRALFCGSREWDDEFIMRIVMSGYGFEHAFGVVIHGGARGADEMAGKLAQEWFQDPEVWEYPADWSKHGRAAGPIRNQQMLDEGKPGVVFAFTDDIENSRGTKDMCDRAKRAGVPVYVIGRYL